MVWIGLQNPGVGLGGTPRGLAADRAATWRSGYSMRRTLTTLALLLQCAFVCAEEQTFRFPESSEWRVLPPQLVNDPEMLLVAIASDGKVSANLSVVELELADEKGSGRGNQVSGRWVKDCGPGGHRN